ncbi:MAG: HDIG domain-containing protein [candidate division NC10 bacterium]|nr:HDIG domain-containing protein [candidate division NC10 bacterium]
MEIEHPNTHHQAERREPPGRESPLGRETEPKAAHPRAGRLGAGLIFVLGGCLLLLSRPQQAFTPEALLSLLAIPALIMVIFYGYLRRWQRQEIARPRSLRMIAVIVLLVSLICRVVLVLARSVQVSFPFIPLFSLEYSIPVALSGVLLSIVFNARLAFAGSLGAILLFAFFCSDPFHFFLVSLCGSLVGILALTEPKERASFLKAGGAIAMGNMGAILILSLLEQRTASLSFELLCGSINGLLVGILALALLPSLEYLFGVTTHFKLLELSNLHRPVLKQLILVAPGTYHHSVVVGTLGEAAAEAIGADSLLVRVSAYYHDIGKMRMPAYFIENQEKALNLHDKLSPSMSSLILTSHVKEGVELARENHLPLPIIDILQQHHGTCLITYFYQKAKEAKNPKLAEVREENYRYAGPKPQTKEAAIVMLADAVEAASRTLTDPTPARIKGMVQRIVNNLFVDGQLEECDLTLKDLHQIAKSFVRILTGIFHHRVDYPGFDFENETRRQGGNGDFGQKSAKEDKDRSRPAKRGHSEDIRRLGV